jgi:GT2 family glycosyltransferase
MTSEISVIVSTRNRADDVVACAKTILANRYPAFELVIVDQSNSTDRQRAEAEVGSDERLRWIATATRGLSVSRNLAVAAARAPILAFTDDDCRVSETWIADTVAEFDADPELSLLFGKVVLRPEDRACGYAAEFEPEQRHELRGALREPPSAWGVGANMAIRRSVFDRLGVFDTALGAGADFFAGEELDFTLRALAAGFKIVHTPTTSVVHLGVRKYGVEWRKLVRGYAIGCGAALFKHIRMGDITALRVYFGFVAANVRRVCANLVRGKRPGGLWFLVFFLAGALASYKYRVDRSSRQYVLR